MLFDRFVDYFEIINDIKDYNIKYNLNFDCEFL